MEIIYTKNFLKDLKRIPKEIENSLKEQEKIFINNWLDPRLHIKRLKEFSKSFSFRITRNYRVLFYFKKIEIAVFFKIGPRKNIYK